MGAGIGQAEHRGRALQQRFHLALLVVRHRHAEARFEIGRQAEIEQRVDRRHAELGSEVEQAALGELGPAGNLGDDGTAKSTAEQRRRLAVEPLPQLGTKLRIAIDRLLAFMIGLGHRPEHAHRLEDEWCLELELEVERPRRHLRHYGVPRPLQRLGTSEHGGGIVVGQGRAGEQRGPAYRTAGGAVDGGELVEGEFGTDGGLYDTAAPGIGQATGERQDLVEARRPARYRLALVADVGDRLGGREAQCARVHRLRDEAAHRRHFVRAGVALRSCFAEHVGSQRRVADQCADVDGGAACGQRIEVLGKGLERPLGAKPRLECRHRHALHVLERADDDVAVRGTGRGDREAAVAHDDGRDTVPRGDGQHAIPDDLGIVMGVDVDEARRDRLATGIDDLVGAARCCAEGDDAAVANAEFAVHGRTAGTVVEHGVGDLQIVGISAVGHGCILRALIGGEASQSRECAAWR